MGKLLFFLAVAVVGWLLFKGLLKKPQGDAKPEAPANQHEQMVKCDLCGVFMPESDSAQLDGKLTCRTPQRCLHRQSA
jgi:Pyruvate/2-oxoacid:ferredoxin oxidoreductase delta subunit